MVDDVPNKVQIFGNSNVQYYHNQACNMSTEANSLLEHSEYCFDTMGKQCPS